MKAGACGVEDALFDAPFGGGKPMLFPRKRPIPALLARPAPVLSARIIRNFRCAHCHANYRFYGRQSEVGCDKRGGLLQHQRENGRAGR